jgi:hypothetical protein
MRPIAYNSSSTKNAKKYWNTSILCLFLKGIKQMDKPSIETEYTKSLKGIGNQAAGA